MSSEFLMQVMAVIASGGAIYGGIRADLKAMHERIKAAHDMAAAAHQRLDAHLDKH